MRSIWKGALSFGLIHIPVRLYSASKSRELKFKLLHKKDLGEIRYARVCKADGKEVPWEDVVKGYEYQEGDYVVLTEEDFAKANLKKTQTIEILDFTDNDQIDSVYYEVPYYLEPEKGSEKAYVLLLEALRRSKKVAVGRYVLRQHEHVGVIKEHNGVLILNQLRYDTQLVNFKALEIPEKGPISKKELDIALAFIKELSKPFHAQGYTDTYTDEIKEIIKKKAKGQKITLKKEKPVKAGEVHDIISLLKASLQEHKKKSAKRRAA
ncbi:MAG: Ku protein [Chlamydiales bacterium]